MNLLPSVCNKQNSRGESDERVEVGNGRKTTLLHVPFVIPSVPTVDEYLAK